MKPRRIKHTDAGPGQGVNNRDVPFRDAETVRTHNTDYSICVHRSTNDSGQNEAERTNSACGNTLSTVITKHFQFHLNKFKLLGKVI